MRRLINGLILFALGLMIAICLKAQAPPKADQCPESAQERA
jgi:hypothetical protein